jgi:phosphatidylethanolamine/phosphatidyl-N-methylethanolamine N-methyltransferase
MDQPKSIYEDGAYDDYLYQGAQGIVMRALHRRMEVPLGPEQTYRLTVEVGAGEGQHLPYIRHAYERYVMTDLREQSTSLKWPPRVEFVTANAEILPFDEATVDRLVTTCVLHHLDHPEQALENWRACVKPGGRLTILLANDPGLVHRVGRRLTTHRAAVKLGINYRLEMAREHRNHALSLMAMVDHVFRDDEVKFTGIPFPWKTWNFNFGSIYQVVKAEAPSMS